MCKREEIAVLKGLSGPDGHSSLVSAVPLQMGLTAEINLR